MNLKKIASVVVFLLATQLTWAADIWVSPAGNDTQSGTKDKPVATIAKAIRIARDLRRLNDASIKGGIHIIVKGGTYQLWESLYIRPEDSGTPESPTTIESAPNEQPIVSGGVPVTGWKKSSKITGLPKQAQGKVWEANIPSVAGKPIEFRQLWLNDAKAIKARDRNGDSMNRILSWDRANETCWIPWKQTASLAKSSSLEFTIHQWWEVAILRVKSVTVSGDSAQLHFYQPESRIQSEHPWPRPWISKTTGNSAFFISNAIELLDEPGEWFADYSTGKLYYWPKEAENMNTVSAVVPVLETLVQMQGSIDNPVSNIHFSGITFAHSGWLRPSHHGHVPHQAGMYMLEAYSLKIPGTPDKKTLENQAWVGRPAAAVEVAYAHNTAFTNCRFVHHASCGLDYATGTSNNLISGNLFKDIGGNGIQLGKFSDESIEAHIPYNPKDIREVSTNDTIANNLITDVTNEDWGCVGIAAGYVKGSRILHNEIHDVSYSGISVGWGWTKTINAMSNNQIVGNKITRYGKRMYDVAAIYTLSAQPGSVITHNYIDSIYKAPYAHIPDHWFYLYCDEGSSYFTVKDNWCPARKFLRNANGPNNIWENNGPQVSDSIKLSAGIESSFQSLLNEKPTVAAWPINKIARQVVEIISKDSLDKEAIKNIFTNVDWTGDLYQWQHHYVFYGYGSEQQKVLKQLQQAFSSAVIKLYEKPLYEFTRERCPDAQTEKDWDNIVLTANLVSDAKKQQEYIDYHNTQFEKWPEVANGFCKASFQQLQVFKYDRQLMLIISIPKGKTLAELDPKTVENNPRVTEWNNIMKQYQEGIEGTKPGETWVFLEK